MRSLHVSVGAGEPPAWPTLVTALRQLSGVLLPLLVTDLCSAICIKSLIRSQRTVEVIIRFPVCYTSHELPELRCIIGRLVFV